ncbi:chromatin associated protein [Acephala macrosclerotiorum]|nr:chromatin associated protein [Acephala macrosclerotiorum]
MQLKKALLEKDDFEAAGNALAELDLERQPEHQKHVGSDWFAIFNPKVPRVLDVDLVHTLQHQSVVYCVSFSYDGKYIATGCDKVAQIFDVVTGQKICILEDESVDPVSHNYIRSACFSPNGRYLATGGEDKLIRVWDIASRSIRSTFVGHEQYIYSLDFARDGRTIASGSSDGTVRLWDIETSQNVLILSIEDGVTAVAFSPDTKYVAAGSLDKSVRVWDVVSGYVVEHFEGPDGHKGSVRSVAFAPNGKYLVSGSFDKTIKMWELATPRGGRFNNAPEGGRCIKTFEGHKDWVLSTAFTPDGNWVLSGSEDCEVQFWDLQTGNTQLRLRGHKHIVTSVAASPSGGCFATGGLDFQAKIWSYKPYP